jgi:hypothetical protein
LGAWGTLIHEKKPEVENLVSVFSGVVDTGNKMITGVVDTAEQLSLVTMTPAINLLLVSMIQLNNDWQ